jgi:hypothetical protein
LKELKKELQVKKFSGSVFIIIFLLVSFPLLASPQDFIQGSDKSYVDESFLGLDSKSKSFSLLDPSRVKMWHSYTFSYFSGGGRSGNIGLYMNTIEYRPSDPLKIQVSLGYLHQPFSVIGDKTTGGKILPNFQLWYHPSSKFYLHINISTASLWYNRYSYDNFWYKRR